MANLDDDPSHHTADKNEETNVPKHHADKKEETVMISRFRKDFNETAFGEDFILPFERFTKPTPTSDMKSHAEIQKMIRILTYWETGVGDMSQSEFRKSHGQYGYRICKTFMAEEYSVNNVPSSID